MVPKVRHVSVVPNVASWWEGRFFHEALAAPKRARKRAAGSTSFTSSLNQMPPIRPTLFAAQCAQKHTHQAANAEPSRRLQAGPSIQQRPPSPTPCCTPASEQASASRVTLQQNLFVTCLAHAARRQLLNPETYSSNQT